MYSKIKSACYVSVIAGFSCSAFADTSYDINTAVSAQQADSIVNAIQSNAGAPSGTQVTDVSTSGSYGLDVQNHLSSITISALNFTVNVPILFTTLTDHVSVRAIVYFTNGDCSKPTNVSFTENGDSSLVDSEIQKYLTAHSSDLIENYFVKMTDLVNYCAVQP